MRVWLFLGLLSILPAFGNRGAEIYTEHCTSCHGDRGQGVADEYDEALVGKKSIASLAKYIHRTMPEEDEDAVVDDDARLVAEYIHKSFYSPEAQARLKPVRKDLLRRTQHQHRRSITDIVQSFRNRAWMGDEHGLRGHYFNKEKMNNRKKALVKRIDPTIDFDVHKKHGVEALNPEAHSIFWTGSILPPETGEYGFRFKSPNGVRIFLNEPNQKKDAFIDAWVSSGNEMRTVEKSTFLLGGHPIPIFIDFVCYKESKSSLLVEWKPPHGTWETIPTRVLYTAGSQKAAIISTPFPADDASLGYERGSSISKPWKEAVANAAIEATSLIFDDIDELARTKFDQPDRREKLQKFCSDFAFRAFCRPLTNSQQKVYIDDVFATAGDDYETALKRSLMLTLTSPYFLYPSLNFNDQGKPDSYSTAAHLALALWDSIPDKRLFEAAQKNQLSNDRQLTDRLWNMLSDSRSKAKLHTFFHHWLNLSEKEDLDKDPKLFPGFNEQIIADLRTSLDLFINEVVWSEQSDYRRLFTEKRIYLNPRLADFYGAQKPSHDGFEPLPTPDKTRAGLFTHPFVLTAFSYHKQTSPIHRGVYLSRNVLGRFLKPPPNAIEFKDADFKPNLTMREKVTEITKDESCMACHSIINPVGFSLENYDAIGRFRTHEKDQPINTVSEYPTPEDTMVKITGPDDLARLAVDSPGAHRAFLKHLFHHLIQQPTNAFGFGTMGSLHENFKNSNFHIRNIIVIMAKDTVPKVKPIAACLKITSLQAGVMNTESHPELALVLDQLFTRHITGEHPEHFSRYHALTGMFETSGLAARLKKLESRTATLADLAAVHGDNYLALAKKEIDSGFEQLSTGDTAVCPDSWLVASHAAGSVCAAVDELYSEESTRSKRAFCAVRPPGHHATPDRGMGFCIFNNVAVGARYAQRKYGVGKVAILDWDVHHGNGTQDVFYEDETVLFCSVHQSPWYPGTGMAEELGSGKGRGFTLNAPLPAGSDMERIGDKIDVSFLSAMRKFKPELVIISAGFDSRLGDPLGKFRLLDEDFKTITSWLRKIAEEFADGRLISVLEGGYSLEGLAAGVQAHVQALE